MAGLTNTNLGSGVTASTFNFLDKMDYSTFYHIYDSGSMSTVLVAALVYYLPITSASLTNVRTATSLTTLTGITPAYTSTGDVLCYGSTSQGIVLIFV